MVYIPVANVSNSLTWMSYIASYVDFPPGPASMEQCSTQCSNIVPNCKFFAIDGPRCHFGEFPNTPSTFAPLVGSTGIFDLHLQQGTTYVHTASRKEYLYFTFLPFFSFRDTYLPTFLPACVVVIDGLMSQYVNWTSRAGIEWSKFVFKSYPTPDSYICHAQCILELTGPCHFVVSIPDTSSCYLGNFDTVSPVIGTQNVNASLIIMHSKSES